MRAAACRYLHAELLAFENRLLDLGVEHNVVNKSGSFFSFNGERLGQGRNNSKAFLDEHQEIAKEIETKVWAALGLGPDLVVPIERDDEAVVAPVMAGAGAIEAA